MFNENEKSELYDVYATGQVAVKVNRKVKDYSGVLWLYIEYRDAKTAKIFFDKNKPREASSSDF